jgi:glycosyltransferase involved in cell wall biosynthesis
MRIRATIGVSVYKQSRLWLKASIDSALSQSCRQLEIIVRLDGPNSIDDDALLWLETKSASDDRLKIVYGAKRVGNFASLKHVFGLSTGAYLIQLDADDKLHPQAVELACQHLDENPNLGFIYSDCLEIDALDNLVGNGDRQKEPYSYLRMLVHFTTFHMRCIRRSTYEVVGGYREAFSLCGDYDLSLRLAEVSDVAYLSLPLYFYRIHAYNTSRNCMRETAVEGLSVARNAFFRRQLANSHYLLAKGGNSLLLIDWKSREEAFAMVDNQQGYYYVDLHGMWL